MSKFLVPNGKIVSSSHSPFLHADGSREMNQGCVVVMGQNGTTLYVATVGNRIPWWLKQVMLVVMPGKAAEQKAIPQGSRWGSTLLWMVAVVV